MSDRSDVARERAQHFIEAARSGPDSLDGKFKIPDHGSVAFSPDGSRAFVEAFIEVSMPPPIADPESPVMKNYLGDAVYVEYDGYCIVLTTEDVYRATNTIIMEPQVYAHLVAFVEALKRDAAAKMDTTT